MSVDRAKRLGAGLFAASLAVSPLFLNGLIATIAGIMIYVSISELIPEGFSYGRRGYTVGGLVAGILAMSVGIYLV